MTARSRYEAAVRSHLSCCREAAPIPPRESLSLEEEAQCRVLGGHLIQWLSEWGPQFLQERAVLSSLRGLDRGPLVCIHSDWPGLVAASEIIGDRDVPVVWGLPSDFESWQIEDSGFEHHVVLRSLFLRVEPESLGADVRREYPLTESEIYLIHVDESILGPLFARGARHLWKWDGHELSLLKEAFQTWIS